MRKRIALIVLLLSPLASRAQNIFNCQGFAATSSGSICGVSNGSSTPFQQFGANTAFNGTEANFVPFGSGHNGYGFDYQTAVNDEAFTSTFTFVPNGQNVVFTLNNTSTQPGYDGAAFRSGAGCEAGFYQAYGIAPNNVFALEIDSYSLLNSTDSSFTYSSVQIYQQNQSPCSPNDAGSGYWPTTKFSTLPVPLDSPSNSQGTTTGDTYSATVSYNGSILTFSMYDVTAGGSCPGASCFTRTWSNVAIPSLVDGTTAYVGLVAGIGITSTHPLYVGSFSYTVDAPSASPSSTPPSAGGATAANPTFSPGAGSYSGTQSVTLSSTTSGANICYTLAPAGLVVTPLPNNTGGCAVGTLYSGPVSVSSSETLYAIAGTNAAGLPSGIAQAAYTIGTTTASTPTSTPTFSPDAGTYTSAQSVSISDATPGATTYYTTDGTTPTTSSTHYTGPITVSSTETLEGIAVATGYTNSAVASAAYSIIGSPSPDAGDAQVINYPSGFATQPSQMSLQNGSVYSGSSIKLTTSSVSLANNAWYKTPVNVQAFTTTFTWTVSCPAKPASCGDGMGFMIISTSNPSSAGFNYSGFSGAQLSWAKCDGSPGATTDCPAINSILVKFDLYNNSTNTDGANLTGFYSGGVYPHENAQPPQEEYDMAPSGISMPSGDLMKATLIYNGTTLMETVTDTVTGATYRNSYSANIPLLVGGNTAYVGFGGSTGAATVSQNLTSWTYTVETPES